MKKICFILFLFLTTIASATNYYVSNTGGGDTLATITEVNSLQSSLVAGDSVLFKRGQIFSGTITIAKSGSAGNNIIYGAYGTGVDPIISGFETLTGWSSQGDTIYYKTISPASAPNLLYFDNANKPKGKWPESGHMNFERAVANVSISDDQLTGTPDWDGAEVVIATNAWTITKKTIVDHTTTTITFNSTTGTIYTGYGYFIQNDVRLLNDLGEWFYNTSTSTTYVYFGAEATGDHVVKMPVLDQLVNITNYGYITFDNITFEGSNTYSFYLSNADYITIQNCAINFSGSQAIYATSGSSYLTVRNNSINNTNRSAIYINDTSPNAIIAQNTIDSSGVYMGHLNGDPSGYGVMTYSTTKIDSNVISNTGYIPIFARLSNNDSIRYNHVYNFGLSKDDGGGIYMHVNTKTGNYIGYNIIRNGGIGSVMTPYTYRGFHGIYLDNGTDSVTIEYNTISGCGYSGINLHSANDININNNTCFDNTYYGISLIYNSAYGYIRNIAIEDNIFVAKETTQNALYFKNWDANGATFGTADNNYYARPVDDDYVFYFYPATGGVYYKTLAQWKILTSQDASSSASPISIAGTSLIYFYYNATGSPVIQALPDSSITLDGTKYFTEYTIPAWGSVVLLNDPDPNVNPPEMPTVTTTVVTSIGLTTATSGGNCTDDGNGTVSAKGVCWSTSPSPLITDSKTTDGTGEGAFTSSITGLTRNTTYYVRAYATNQIGTAYGYEESFKTPRYLKLMHGTKHIFINGKQGVKD